MADVKKSFPTLSPGQSTFLQSQQTETSFWASTKITKTGKCPIWVLSLN